MRYAFANCLLETQQRVLFRQGQSFPLRPKVFQVLHYLLVHHDRIVTQQELVTHVWPNIFVTPQAVASVLKAVRRVLGDQGHTPRVIQTVRGHGYRFIAPVTKETLVQREAVAPAELAPRPTLAALTPLPPVHPMLAGRRRQLTVLFCNLREVTPGDAGLDPEDVRSARRLAQATCHTVIQQWEGYLAWSLGDGVWAYFGYPVAREEAAHQAVQAGLAVVEALTACAPRLAQRWGVSLTVRVGIHTGLVVVDATDLDGQPATAPVDETPTVAAQLSALAPPTSVVMSGVTARLVEGCFVCQACETHALTDGAGTISVYRVQQASGTPHRLEATSPRRLPPIVGRDAERALCLARWAVVRQGTGQAVLLRGELGSGKSRFVRVMCEHVRDTGGTSMVLHCAPAQTQTPLYPVLTHLQRVLQWHRDEPSTTTLEKLEQCLQVYDLPVEDMAPLLAGVLGLSPPPQRYPARLIHPSLQPQHTQEALMVWLAAAATRQPVLLVCEDLHWADPSTLELIGRFLARLQTIPILLLLTSRPEFRPPWTRHANYTQIVLPRLEPTQTMTMMARLVRGKALPTRLVQYVVETTEGIPLFVREYTRMLLEEGWLREAADRYAMTRPLPRHTVPVTLQEPLMARFDRLTPGAEVARLAALCGREFAVEVLQAVAPLHEGTIQQGLAQLLDAELISPVGWPQPSRYRFTHGLLQEVAAQSVLQQTRQQLRRQIAQVVQVGGHDKPTDRQGQRRGMA